MPAGDVFGLDGFFLNKSNPVVVSTIGINSTGSSAGIAVTAGTFSAGTVTLNLSNAAGLSTTPFYTGAKIAVSGVGNGYNGNFVVTGFAGTTTVSYATTGYVGSITTPLTGLTGTLALLVTNTQITNTTWSSAQTHGWFGGGFSSINLTLSTIDRIDFSNDTGTTNIRRPLTLARYWFAATGNSNYGWFAGGANTPPVYSTVDRIDFSNDSATASVRGPLSSVRWDLAATANSNYGWFGGGITAGPNVVSIIDRIDFSNDSSTISPRGTLSSPVRVQLAATGNSNYGWFGGGYVPSLFAQSTTVDRIDFSNDSGTALVRGSLSLARESLAATGNSNYGWFGGGGTSPTPLSRVNRIDFSNDSPVALIRGSLSSSRYKLAATGNSNYGWWGGGNPTTSRIDRIDFSNDSVSASVRGPLSSTKYALTATSGQARSSSVRLQKGGNFGWFGGGFNAGYQLTVDRIDFSNDSISASPKGSLFSIRGYFAATGNSNYGWWGGGNTPTTVSRVERIDFSNDGVTALPRGPLSATKYKHAATGNSNYGWFGGGLPGPATLQTTTVNRIDFSNDSTTASPRGPLSLARDVLAATGNSNYGWFGGGYTILTPRSRVDRIDFSNDSATASVRGPLSLERTEPAATGNSNYGWFGGGNTPTTVSRVDRIDFSNDGVTALVRGNLVNKWGHGATGNSNYGWFGGGVNNNPGTIVATVNRIDFSNDSSTASPRGSLTQARYLLAATSNSTR